jgi:hypothetical protein
VLSLPGVASAVSQGPVLTPPAHGQGSVQVHVVQQPSRVENAPTNFATTAPYSTASPASPVAIPSTPRKLFGKAAQRGLANPPAQPYAAQPPAVPTSVEEAPTGPQLFANPEQPQGRENIRWIGP